MALAEIFRKVFGSKADRDLKQLQPILNKVLEAYERIDRLSDDELRAKSAELRQIIRDRIAADESRISEIKAELEKDIPVDEKESLANESDKLSKKIVSPS